MRGVQSIKNFVEFLDKSFKLCKLKSSLITENPPLGGGNKF